MKNPTLLLIGLLTATTCLSPVAGWGQETTAQAVSPDTAPLAPAAELTEEEHEFLLALKGTAAAPFEVRTPSGNGQNDAESRGTGRSLIEEIEALDKVLSKATQIKTAGTSRLLLELMGAPELAVRITALNWLVGRPDLITKALSGALRDKDPLLRSVAAQMLLERGVNEEALKRIQTAAETDAATLEQMLHNSLPAE